MRCFGTKRRFASAAFYHSYASENASLAGPWLSFLGLCFPAGATDGCSRNKSADAKVPPVKQDRGNRDADHVTSRASSKPRTMSSATWIVNKSSESSDASVSKLLGLICFVYAASGSNVPWICLVRQPPNCLIRPSAIYLAAKTHKVEACETRSYPNDARHNYLAL